MRPMLQDLYNKLSGRVVFIVGGGPSCETQDLSVLDKKHTIVLNKGFKSFPNATALYWCDEDWASKNFDDLQKHPCKLRFNAKFHVSQVHFDKNTQGLAGCTLLKRTGDFGIDSDVNHVRGNNSGAHAINLAANMGARKIVLLGYDMRIVDGKTHWHGGYQLAMRPSIYNDLFIPSINSMAIPLKTMGVKVVNATPNSNLKCFPYEPLESLV